MLKLIPVFLFFGAANLLAQPSFFYPRTVRIGAPITSIVGGDFNKDGIGDFAVSFGTSGLAVFLGKPDGTFIRKDITNLPANFTVQYILAAADMDDDGKLDLVGEGYTTASLATFVLYGNGDGTFGPPAFPVNSSILGVADFNGDRFQDFLVRSGLGIAVELGNGDGTFKGLGPRAGVLGSEYGYLSNLLIADFNRDGLPDVAWGSREDGSLDVFLSNGDGSLREIGISAYNLYDINEQPMAAGDLNGDGKADIVKQGPLGVAVLLGDGAGNFQLMGGVGLGGVLRPTYPPPLFGGSVAQVALVDFDGDKKLDFASSYYVYPGNGDGSLRPSIYFGQMDSAGLIVPFANPLVVQDVNGDGKPDIVGIGPDRQSIGILINSSGTPVASAPAFLVGNGDVVLAPGALGSIFGAGLATITASAVPPLPTTLGNTSVELVDYSGKTFQAPILYVSPTQINFQVPDDAALGLAIINVIGNGRPRGAHSTYIQDHATSFFTLDGTGKGAPVSSAVRVDANGSQAPIPTTSCTPDGHCTGLPIPVGSSGQVYLSLYGTGFRHATPGQCSVGGNTVQPTYVGPQSPGSLIDQANIPIPASTPKGSVDITCGFGPSNNQFGNGNTVNITVQ